MNLKKIIKKGQTKNTNDPFYQSSLWKRLRAFKLIQSPNCEECLKKGVVINAEMVDHVIQISRGGDRTNYENLMSLCNHCHAVKRAKESNKSRI